MNVTSAANVTHTVCTILLYYSLCPVAPDITLDPDSVEILEGMSATFLCGATGRPRPTITWYRTIGDSDTLERVNVSDNRVTLSENENGDRELMSSLTVTNVLPPDAATYICIAENGVDIEMSNDTLTVNGTSVVCQICNVKSL